MDDDEQEDEYLRPFKFDENLGRAAFDKLDDGEDDDDDDEDTDDYVGDGAADGDEEEVRYIYNTKMFIFFSQNLKIFNLRFKKNSNMKYNNGKNNHEIEQKTSTKKSISTITKIMRK